MNSDIFDCYSTYPSIHLTIDRIGDSYHDSTPYDESEEDTGDVVESEFHRVRDEDIFITYYRSDHESRSLRISHMLGQPYRTYTQIGIYRQGSIFLQRWIEWMIT